MSEPSSPDPATVAAEEAAVAARADADDAREDAEEAREEAAAIREQVDVPGRPDAEFGNLGRPLRRDSPFMIGFLGALGVLLALAIVHAIAQARSVIILIVVALFLAVGLNPVVECTHPDEACAAVSPSPSCSSWSSAPSLASGSPSCRLSSSRRNAFVKELPNYLDDLRGNRTIRQFDNDYHVIEKAKAYVTGPDLGQRVFGGLLGVGRVVLNAVFSAFTLLIMTLYFLAALPSMKRQAYQLVPASRRERVTLLTDEILVRIGGFVSGALTVAFIAAVTSYIFLMILGLPYALALAVFVGLLDLIPLVGATIAAIAVSTLGFIDSLAAGVACVIFYVAYQQFENYVIYPRVMRRAVDVPAPVTVVAVLVGGALLGITGALLAIPIAAAALLVIRQVTIPRMHHL